jgi:4-amino-4-deoxy-L-arabinose transferase-like glycosyltransferase
MLKQIKSGSWSLLILIVVLGAVLRFYNLTSNPPALNWDEVSHGYNAYSILTTGKDEWGMSFPSIFRAYGDYKLPVYVYLTVFSVKIFGLTEFAVRLPSLLAGIGIIIFSYLLTYELFKRRAVALLAAFLVALEPWSLFLSRGAFEANLALFLIISGVYYFLKSLKAIKYFVPAVVLLGLSVWTYNSARIFVPLLLLSLFLIYRRELIDVAKKGRKVFSVGIFVFMILFIPMFIQLLKPVGLARYEKVSIINEGSIARINQARGESDLSPFLNRLVNNKLTYAAPVIAKNWLSHFSPAFLFTSGGSNYQFSIPGRGLLYILNIVPLVVGLLWVLSGRSKAKGVVAVWLFFSPVASALTSEAPHVLRSIVILPVPMILSSLGVVLISEFMSKQGWKNVFRFVIVAYFLGTGILAKDYLSDYFNDYKTTYSWSWQYGYKEVIGFVQDNYSEYDKIIVTKKYGEPHEYFLFYMKYDPEKYQADPGKITFYQTGWYWVDKFDKFYFVNDWQVPDVGHEFDLESGGVVDCSEGVKCLLITSPENYPSGWNKIETIEFLDGATAFEIFNNLPSAVQ